MITHDSRDQPGRGRCGTVNLTTSYKNQRPFIRKYNHRRRTRTFGITIVTSAHSGDRVARQSLARRRRILGVDRTSMVALLARFEQPG